MASGSGSRTKKSNNTKNAKSTGKTSQGRTSGSRSTAGSRRTSTKRGTNSGKKVSAESYDASSQLRDEVFILIALACAVILILSNFNLAGQVGRSIKWFMFGLIGVMEYIFPVIVAASIIFLVVNKDLIRVARIKTAAVYILIIVLAAVWNRLTDNPRISENLGTFFRYCADEKVGGGFLGGAVCKLLSPLGFLGTLAVLVVLIIICLVVITEKSFIKGIKNVSDSSQRMMREAKQDYNAYKEHSARMMAEDMESEEEYHLRREQERAQRRKEKIERKQKQLELKKEREERLAKARMNNKVRGVTSDTTLPREAEAADDIDIHEIVVDNEREDEYSQDIYDPVNEIDIGKGNIWEPATAQYGESQHGTAQSDALQYDAAQYDDSQDYITNSIMQGIDVNTGEIIDNNSYESNLENGGAHIDGYETGGIYGADNNFMTDSASENCNNSVAGNDFTADSNSEAESGFLADNNSGRDNISEEVIGDNTDTAKAFNKPKPKKKYVFPPISLLNRNTSKSGINQERENRNTAMRLQQTLQNFGVKVTITDISCGPSVTRYELQPEQGVKVSKIVSLSDDIKLNLAAADIRIEAPIPGKAAIGIEVPNKEAGSVFLRELLETQEFKSNPSGIAFAAGKDIAGKTIVADIAKMPHLLIAGATGSGKSVCINTIIMSILYKASPDDVKLIMVDPKVVELSVYNGIPHLLIPVVTDPKKASGALNWAVNEMTDRYKKFAAMNVRDLKGYNAKADKIEIKEGEEPVEKMPQIVIIIDELADLMMVAPGEVEDSICRLAQLARAAGIHLVIATQRPSVNVITGLIKANVPSRIAFSVSSGVDSRTIIDMNGAEKLLGKGDMLYFPSNFPKPLRVQGAFISDEEVGKVVDFLKSHMDEEVQYDESITNTEPAGSSKSSHGHDDDRDSLFADAGRFVIEKEKGSIGMLQRYFKIGFNRAGRIMDQLAEAGVVGQELGTKPRKVAMTLEEFETYLKNTQ